MVCERDTGTIHRFSTYPLRPNTFKVVSGAANNGSGLIRITTSAVHGYSTDDIIYHAEITGTVEANNIYKITVIDTTHYDLVGSTFTNAYVSGGISTDTPIDIFDCFVLRDPDTGTEYEVVVGLDEDSKTRLYLWDGTAWIELTQKINALINGAPGAPATTATTQVVTIDTPTDENGAVYTLAADTLNGYVVYNITRSTASFVLDSTATTITIPHNVTIAPFSWANNDALVFFKCTGIYDGFNYVNGTEPHVRHLLVEAQKKMTIFYADNSAATKVRKDPIQIAKQDDARNLFKAITIAANATGSVTLDSPSDGQTVTINGVVLTYQTTPGAFREFSSAATLADVINTDPTLAALISGAAVGSAVNITAVTAGSAANSITLVAPVGFILSGGTLTGGSDASETSRIVLPSGYYVEKAYFTTGFQSAGSIASPRLGTSGVETLVIGDGLQVQLTYSEVVNNQSYQHARVYFTLIYRGYQESDPIAQIILSGSVATNFALVSCLWKIDPVLLNKDVTAIRMYIAAETNSKSTQSDWPEDAEEYLFRDEILIRETSFDYNNASQYCYSSTITTGGESTYPSLLAAAADDLLTRLNHEPQTVRTVLKPFFGIKVSRQQGAVQVVDQDDQTLRRSSYNGDVVHEDDNYPGVTPDEDGNVLHLPLSGSGEIMELTLKNGIIHIHRKNEIETFNLFNNENDYLLERNVAEFSIHESERGLTFCGPGGVRLLPVGGGKASTLNPLWDNFFDGTLLIDDDSASYITDGYREDIVGGYFSVLEEDWFACQVNIDAEDGGGSEILVFRFSWKTGKWMVRKFHLGNVVAPNLDIADGQSPIKSLIERSDGTMMIVTARGLFKYPYTGARRYEDGVYSDGRSSDRGIPTDITLNIGGLSNAIPGANVVGLKVQHQGESVDGYGFATIRYYRNNDLSTFETKRFRVDDPPIFRELERGGPVESMQVRVSLPEDDLDNFKKLDISQIIIAYVPVQIPADVGR